MLIVNAARYRCTVTNYTCRSGSPAATVSTPGPSFWETDISGWHTQSHRPSVARLSLGSRSIYMRETILSLNSAVYAFASLARPSQQRGAGARAHTRSDSHTQASLWSWLYSSFHWWVPCLVRLAFQSGVLLLSFPVTHMASGISFIWT